MLSEAERYRSRYGQPKVDPLAGFQEPAGSAGGGGYFGNTGTVIADFLTKNLPGYVNAPNPTFDPATGGFNPAVSQAAAVTQNRVDVAARLMREKAQRDALDAFLEGGANLAPHLGAGFDTAAKAQSEKALKTILPKTVPVADPRAGNPSLFGANPQYSNIDFTTRGKAGGPSPFDKPTTPPTVASPSMFGANPQGGAAAPKTVTPWKGYTLDPGQRFPATPDELFERAVEDAMANGDDGDGDGGLDLGSGHKIFTERDFFTPTPADEDPPAGDEGDGDGGGDGDGDGDGDGGGDGGGFQPVGDFPVDGDPLAIQHTIIKDAVTERVNAIQSAVDAGIVDINAAEKLYDSAIASIYADFQSRQSEIVAAFESSVTARNTQAATDRTALLADLQAAGIDPALLGGDLAIIDALTASGQSAQSDYLTNLSNIGAMSDAERQLVGDYTFGGYRQDLTSEGRSRGLDATLAGVDRTEFASTQANQANQLAPFLGADPAALFAGLGAGVDVAGMAENRSLQENAQQFALQQLLAQQAYGTSERLGSQSYGTSERLGSQSYGTSERLGSQSFASGQQLFDQLMAQQISPYQQAQLDLSQQGLNLDYFQTLNEMSQPSAQDLQLGVAADFKSAMQKISNYQPSPLEQQLGIASDPFDLLSPAELLAMQQFGVDPMTVGQVDQANVNELSAALGLSPTVFSQAVESGVASQLVANSIAAQNDPMVTYIDPNLIESDIPLSQAMDLYEYHFGNAVDEPLLFGASDSWNQATSNYGFPGVNIGTVGQGVDLAALEKIFMNLPDIDRDQLIDAIISFGP